MADEMIINGVASYIDDRTVDITGEEHPDGSDSKVAALTQKIAALELEKRELVHKNKVITERIEKFKDEIEATESVNAEMKREIEQSEADKKALESIAARAAELETEVSRLQHDLISSMTEGQEANAELLELKSVVEELRNSDLEKGSKLEVLEKERNLLLERINKDSEGLAESESRIRELEKKIEALEVRENNNKSERVEVEERMRGRLEEREDQIRHLKKLVEEFQSVITRNRAELERLSKEREELEIMKNDLEALFKKSERKVKEMELKMGELNRELEGSEMISGPKEKTVEVVNGKDVFMDRGVVEHKEKGLMGLKLQWPVVAASAGAIAAVAIVYLRYTRQR